MCIKFKAILYYNINPRHTIKILDESDRPDHLLGLELWASGVFAELLARWAGVWVDFSPFILFFSKRTPFIFYL